jgi:hypothetical protein
LLKKNSWLTWSGPSARSLRSSMAILPEKPYCGVALRGDRR